MSQLLTPATFEFFARYLLAGFIVYSVRSRYILGERPKQTEILFEVVVLSMINQLAYLVLSGTIEWGLSFWQNSGDWLVVVWLTNLSFYIEVLVLPAFIGLLFGLNLQHGWNNSFLRRLSMPVVQPTRRAYDHVFGEVAEASFVILTFENGTMIHGYYGNNSFAGSDTQNGDILLERLYTVDKDGKWSEAHPSRSALVNLSGLRSIEFVPINQEIKDGE